MTQELSIFEFPVSDTNKWYVCHGNGPVVCIRVKAGRTGSTGQPLVEEYDFAQEAHARAKDLGWQPPRTGKATVTGVSLPSAKILFDTEDPSFYALAVGSKVSFTQPSNILPLSAECLDINYETGVTRWSESLSIREGDSAEFNICWKNE